VFLAFSKLWLLIHSLSDVAVFVCVQERNHGEAKRAVLACSQSNFGFVVKSFGCTIVCFLFLQNNLKVSLSKYFVRLSSRLSYRH